VASQDTVPTPVFEGVMPVAVMLIARVSTINVSPAAVSVCSEVTAHVRRIP